MNYSSFFKFWDKLSKFEQDILINNALTKKITKGTIMDSSFSNCNGLLLIHSGELRVYITSESGKEITLYRLFPSDICLLSASCILNNFDFEVIIESEKDSIISVIDPHKYKDLMSNSSLISNYTNEIMAAKFSEVLWLINETLFSSTDTKIANFLLSESKHTKKSKIQITHEKISRHIGSAREVVTRILKYFQREGVVTLHRGYIEIINYDKLKNISNN